VPTAKDPKGAKSVCKRCGQPDLPCCPSGVCFTRNAPAQCFTEGKDLMCRACGYEGQNCCEDVTFGIGGCATNLGPSGSDKYKCDKGKCVKDVGQKMPNTAPKPTKASTKPPPKPTKAPVKLPPKPTKASTKPPPKPTKAPSKLPSKPTKAPGKPPSKPPKKGQQPRRPRRRGAHQRQQKPKSPPRHKSKKGKK
jgi:hypothetical protein